MADNSSFSVETATGAAVRVATEVVVFKESDERLLERLRAELMTAVPYALDAGDYKRLSDIPDARTAGIGDCKSMSVAMREMLIAEGFPAEALLLSTVTTEKGQPHMVLLIRGKYRNRMETRVFDIRVREIAKIGQLIDAGYQFNGIQSASGADAILLRWDGRRYL
ncbi:MAG: transglutaminase-like cysteine peptidase [Brevundimonas sp.]